MPQGVLAVLYSPKANERRGGQGITVMMMPLAALMMHRGGSTTNYIPGTAGAPGTFNAKNDTVSSSPAPAPWQRLRPAQFQRHEQRGGIRADTSLGLTSPGRSAR